MTVEINSKRKAVEISWDPKNLGGKKRKTAAGVASQVRIYATGAADDKHSTDPLKNDGLAKVSYPAGFHGKSKIQVKYLDGDLLDEGEITV